MGLVNPLHASTQNLTDRRFSPPQHNSTTEYLKKLKLLLNKSQSQLQSLAQSHRRATVAAAAAAGAGGGGGQAAVAPGGELTKYYVDVDPDATRGAYGTQGDAAMQMMIQRPPIAPGEMAATVV
jgi:hypothetical protein